jgi:hypothetical protein
LNRSLRQADAGLELVDDDPLNRQRRIVSTWISATLASSAFSAWRLGLAARNRTSSNAGSRPGAGFPEGLRKLTSTGLAFSATVSFLARSRIHTPGHFQSYGRSGNRGADDRFQSTAAMG